MYATFFNKYFCEREKTTMSLLSGTTFGEISSRVLKTLLGINFIYDSIFIERFFTLIYLS